MKLFEFGFGGERFTYAADCLDEAQKQLTKDGYCEGNAWQAREVTGEELQRWFCLDEEGRRLTFKDVAAGLVECECVASTCHP